MKSNSETLSGTPPPASGLAELALEVPPLVDLAAPVLLSTFPDVLVFAYKYVV